MIPFARLLSGTSLAGGGHGATCAVYIRPTNSPANEEIGALTGTMVSGSTVDTTNQLIHTPGTAGSYASFPNTGTNYDVPLQWTLELYVRNVAATDGGGIIHRGSGGGGRWILFATGSSGGLDVYFDGISGSPILSASGVFAADGVWRHIAIVRNNNAWALYKDGVSVSTFTGALGSTFLDNTATLNIGNDAVDLANRAVAGDFSRIKLSKTNLWTANFTPPARTDP